jgi:hypothetical protein
MVEVGDGEVKAELWAEAGEEDYEGCGVGAAGDGDDDAFAFGKDTFLADVMKDATFEGRGDAGGGERGGGRWCPE